LIIFQIHNNKEVFLEHATSFWVSSKIYMSLSSTPKKRKKKEKFVKNEIQDQKKKHKAMVSFDFQMSPLVWWRKKEMWTKFISKGSSTSFGNSLTLCIRVLPCFLAYRWLDTFVKMSMSCSQRCDDQVLNRGAILWWVLC
jgi:hypothetical protein